MVRVTYARCPSCQYANTPDTDKFCLYCHERLKGVCGLLFKGYQPKTLHGRINRLFGAKGTYNHKGFFVRRAWYTKGRETELILEKDSYINNEHMSLITKCGGDVTFINTGQNYTSTGKDEVTIIRLGTRDVRM